MKNFSTLFTLLFFSFTLSAQITLPCVDSLLRPPNPWFTCYDGYNPVCGCDSVTYRNFCFAYNKGGVNYTRPGICGKDFYDIDLVPIPVTTEPAEFSMATRVASSCYIFITDAFGGKVYERSFRTYYSDEIVRFEIDMNSFRNGIYALIAVVNDEKKFVKFVKVKN